MDLAPIVLFVYNRPWHTQKVLKSLARNSLSKNSTLFIYSDGPKNPSDIFEVNQIDLTRSIIRKKKWCKEVVINEKERNIGLAQSIVKGVTEIVNRYGKVIVLEDDLVLSEGFLQYMNEALAVYEKEEMVMHISGYMFPLSVEFLSSTFFYNTGTCWGWATWARAWKYFNCNASELLEELKQKGYLNKFNLEGFADFDKQLEFNINGSMNTWAVKWYASFLLHDGYALHPFHSLVNNIGHDCSGSNCDMDQRYTWKKIAKTIPVNKITIEESTIVRNEMKRFYKQRKNYSAKSKSRVVRYLKTIKEKGVKFAHIFSNSLYRKNVLQQNEFQNDLKRILSMNRFIPTQISFLGKNFRILDGPSFLFMYNEIIVKELYKFKSDNDRPYIVDCGSNIGLSIIYFKMLFPNAEIIGFEADKEVFLALKENLESFDFSNIQVFNEAIWNCDTTTSFYSEGSDGGRIAIGDDISNLIQVKTTRLGKFLKKNVDFLKLDIEGAETKVLVDCEEHLMNVKNLFVEYHSFENENQTLDELLAVLKRCGFRYFISHVGITSKHPFIITNKYLSIDNQLNIFATRK